MCIRDSSKGAYYYSKEEQGYDPGFSVKAVDTTGCGDSFMGAILYHLACEPHTPLSKAVRTANAVSYTHLIIAPKARCIIQRP